MDLGEPKKKKRRLESEYERRARLDVRNERARAMRRAETEGEKRARLDKRNERDRVRRRVETSAETENRLEKRKVALAEESDQDRGARLEHMRRRLAFETPEERVARLESSRVLQHQRLATETPEERATRLEHLKQNRDAHRDNSQEAHLPLLQQVIVKDKMDNFHREMSSIESPTCSVCLEKFPGMKMASQSAECQRCFRDKKVPKLYSTRNNMSPGTVPPELQVSHINCFL